MRFRRFLMAVSVFGISLGISLLACTAVFLMAYVLRLSLIDPWLGSAFLLVSAKYSGMASLVLGTVGLTSRYVEYRFDRQAH